MTDVLGKITLVWENNHTKESERMNLGEHLGFEMGTFPTTIMQHSTVHVKLRILCKMNLN